MNTAAGARFRWQGRLARDVGALAVLAAGSLGAGLLLNRLSRVPLPPVHQPEAARLRATVAALAGEARPLAPPAISPRAIGLDEFQAFAGSGQGWVVDARPAAFHRRGHVPGAVSLSREEFAADYARERARLAAHRAWPVAVYCTEADCQDSALVASALAQLGFGPLLIYREGWAEWTRAGLPEESVR